MYYTGIDLHKKTSFITTVNDSGKVVFRRNFANQEEDILNYFVNLDGPTKIVIESMCSWYWLHDLLKAHNFRVVISNPLKTKAIASAKIKNDKVDSHMLAQLLRADLIATVHVCNLKTRKLKELLRHRQRLVRNATRMKNRMHMLLMKNNISIAVRDLFGIKGMKCLKEVELPIYHRQQLKSYLTLYGCLNEQIEPLTKRIHHLADKDPMANLLVTIPGIGPLTAMFIIAEIEDISRFPSYRNLSSYAGLVPCLDASADKSRTGRITKQGSPYLRTALVEAARVIPRMKKSRLNVFFRKRIVMKKINYLVAVLIWALITPYTAVSGGLPDPGVKFVKGHVAIVITDPQVDFLSPKGVTWHLVGKNVTENNTVENIDRLMKIAGLMNIPLFISPHYYF